MKSEYKPIAIILLLAALVVASSLYLDTTHVEEGSILGVSQTNIGTDPESGVTYHYITVVQDIGPEEVLRTFTTTESASFDSATTSSGEQVEGSIETTFSIKANKLGWETNLDSRTSPDYVDHLYDKNDGAWDYINPVSMTHEFSDVGFPYFTSKTGQWTPIWDYDVTIMINGNPHTIKITDSEANSGTRRVVYDASDKAPIYWEEAGGLYGQNTESHPYITPENEIIPYMSNQRILIMKDNMDLNTLLAYPSTVDDSWNNVMSGYTDASLIGTAARDRLDMESDGELDELDGFDRRFDVDDLCTINPSYLELEEIAGGYIPYMYDVKTPKDYEMSIPSYENYEIDQDGTPTLIYKTNFRVLGTLQIPVEYGDVYVHEKSPVPKLGEITTSGKLYEGGSTTLKVPVTCEDEAGKITLELMGDNITQYFTWTPETISENFDKGETKTLEFTLTCKEVPNDISDFGYVLATGTGGTEDKAQYKLEIIDTDSKTNDDFVHIKIHAVDASGKLLGTEFPIMVSQTNTIQFGTWSGSLLKGEVEISGIDTLGYTAQPKTITVTKEGQEEYLVYTAVGGPGPKDDGTNPVPYILAILGVIFIGGICIYGYMRYTESSTSTPKRKTPKSTKKSPRRK